MSDADKVRGVLNKIYGADVVYLMSDVGDAGDDAIPTGIAAVDFGLFGIGGFPRGHFLELAGEEKAGKTTLIQHMMATAQDSDLVPLVIDPKGAVTSDVARCRRIGVDPDGVVIVPVDSSEDALQRTREGLKKLKKEGIGVAFFWDDMGLTPTESELAPTQDRATKRDNVKVGAKAQAVWRFCRTMAGECYRVGAPMVVVNQLTAVIATGWGAQYAPKETTAGGFGLKYAARIRVVLRSGKKIKKGKRNIGQVVYAETVANAFHPPFQRTRLYLNFRNGYDSDLSSLITAEAEGVVRKTRGRYRIKGASRGTKGLLPGDMNDEFIYDVECKLWPWMGENYTIGVDGDDEDIDEDEAEEDEFAEGWLEDE